MKKTKFWIIALCLVTLTACGGANNSNEESKSSLRPLTNELNRYTHHDLGFFIDVPQQIYVPTNCDEEKMVDLIVLEEGDSIHFVPKKITNSDCKSQTIDLSNHQTIDPNLIGRLDITIHDVKGKDGLKNVVKSEFGNGCAVGVLKAAENSTSGNGYFVGVIQDEDRNEKCEWTDVKPGLKFNSEFERAATWTTPTKPIGWGENGQGPFLNDIVTSITFIP